VVGADGTRRKGGRSNQMTKAITLAQRLRYEFDKTMSAGPIALIGWLAISSIVVIGVAAGFLSITHIAQDGGHPLGFVEAAWESLMRTIDSGTLGGDVGWSFRVVMLVVTLWGIFVVSSLIGLLSAGVQSKLDELRKGRSFILERDHSIILNWSASVFDIISQLCVAHAHHERFRIVIMADKDKVEMEDEIASKLTLPRNTRVICRSGDPPDLYDLEIVNLESAKAVIVVSPESADPDSQVIKTILALVHDPRRRQAKHHIAAEFRSQRTAEIARAVGGDEVQIILADDLISRIIVHSSRQAGLSAVYSELLDFEGCEIYTTRQEALVGATFGAALAAFDTSALIGLCDEAGHVRLNPPMDTPIGAQTRLIVIAEEREAIVLAPAPAAGVGDDLIRGPGTAARAPERSLILGWNRRGPVIINELSCYLAAGSEITVVADAPDFTRDVEALEFANPDITLAARRADTSHHVALEGLDVGAYDHVIVLAYSDQLSAQAADTRTLVTLLHLRHITQHLGRHVNVVSEMADIRNRELAEVTRADDFVVSNKLVSLMLAQASENEFLAAIFKDLLDEDGSEIYMRPVETYVAIEEPVDFYTILESARRRGEVAFGYFRRRADETYDRNLGGVALNPKKSDKVAYAPGDLVVVLAEI
jgi:voltage-gated potassium channel Kch